LKGSVRKEKNRERRGRKCVEAERQEWKREKLSEGKRGG